MKRYFIFDDDFHDNYIDAIVDHLAEFGAYSAHKNFAIAEKELNKDEKEPSRYIIVAKKHANGDISIKRATPEKKVKRKIKHSKFLDKLSKLT